MFTRFVFVFCLFWSNTHITAQDSSVSANNARSRRHIVDEFLTTNACGICTSTLPRPVVTLPSGLDVMCDTKTDGGRWTVIQRRFNGSTNFSRDWNEYKHGFGEVDGGEFWLGNENIYRLTSLAQHELRVDFKYEKKDYYAKYSSFNVGSERESYKLKVTGFSGNTGDALKPHNNCKFSTFDRDNDIGRYQNCALKYLGGWWYHECHTANLNGEWGNMRYGRGVTWEPTTTQHNSATFTEMKIRPI
ncbi:ficolin-2-like [Physella acuta]|uniref:ficolin-2-like n=1 Tax=Physella acuta TaxID=109671 RepID=UPI0027DD8E8E|nr:ficolin-2-like [Physella acuta]